MERIRYYAKAQAGPTWLVAAAGVALVLWPVLAGVFRQGARPPQPADTYVLLQAVLPVALALMLSGLPSAERDAGAAEVHLTYPHPAWLRLLEQAALTLAAWGALAATVGAAIHVWYAPLPAAELLRVAVPPALGLGGAALAGGALARNQVGGVLFAGIWWAVDLVAPGLNRIAYTLYTYCPMEPSDSERMPVRLIAAFAAGLAVALWLAERRSRWVSGS